MSASILYVNISMIAHKSYIARVLLRTSPSDGNSAVICSGKAVLVMACLVAGGGKSPRLAARRLGKPCTSPDRGQLATGVSLSALRFLCLIHFSVFFGYESALIAA